MIEVKEINKNRKAKFERLLVDYVNNRIDADAVLGRWYIYLNLQSSISLMRKEIF